MSKPNTSKLAVLRLDTEWQKAHTDYFCNSCRLDPKSEVDLFAIIIGNAYTRLCKDCFDNLVRQYMASKPV